MDTLASNTPFWSDENYVYYWLYYFQPLPFSDWNQYEQNEAEENPVMQMYMLNYQYDALVELPMPVDQANIDDYGSTYPLPDMGTSYYNVYNVPMQQLALSNVPEPFASMQRMGFKRYEAAAAAVRNQSDFGNRTFINYWEVKQDCYYPLPSHFIDMDDFE